MLQLKDNPPLSYSPESGDTGLAESDWQKPWMIAYCKPRQEKALAWELRKQEITYFLPMVLRETYSGGRRRQNLYPLFTSYLFFAGAEDERLVALRTERIPQIITVKDAAQPTLRRELASLEQALRCNPKSVELHPRLVPGTLVTIKSGPFKGVEGIVISARNKKKLWLGVSALGVGVTIEIPADFVDV